MSAEEQIGPAPEPGDDESVLVRAPIVDPIGPVASETMHALRDPGGPDQAILLNAPFWVDELNFGDIVRIGPPDDGGFHPILEVVVASGHRRVLVATGQFDASELDHHLEELHPPHALQVEGWRSNVLSISVHPDFDPEDVLSIVDAWLDEQGARLDDEDVILSPVFETRLGALAWPEGPRG